MTAKQLRAKVFKDLKSHGFRPANSLPLPDLTRPVRPREEIAARLLAMHAMYLWVGFRAENAPPARLRKYVERNGLRRWLTETESPALDMHRTRARDEYMPVMHGQLDSMWALSWVLGFKLKPHLDWAGTEFHTMVHEFLPGLDGTIDGFLADCRPRPAEDVIAMEYRFFCAHGAVRSAQGGAKTVPKNFDPNFHGEAIRARRHSLTWCLSPGVAWDEAAGTRG